MGLSALHDGRIVKGCRKVLQGLEAGALYKVAHIFKITKAGRSRETAGARFPKGNMQLCALANRPEALMLFAKVKLRHNKGVGVVGVDNLAQGLVAVENGVTQIKPPIIFASVVPLRNLFSRVIHVLSPFGVWVFLILTIL